MIVKGTLPQWIATGSLVVIALVLGMHWLGLSDSWVTAIFAALAVIVSIVAIMIPLSQDTKRKRREHLKILIDEILAPISGGLQEKHLGVVSRSTFPLDWRQGYGLVVKSRLPLFVALSAPEAPRGLYKKRYEDIKKNHYPAVIGYLEEFKRDFEGFLDATLQQARVLEKELVDLSDLRALDDAEGVGSCNAPAQSPAEKETGIQDTV